MLNMTKAVSFPVRRLIVSITFAKKMMRYAYAYLDLVRKKTYRCIDNCRYIDHEEKSQDATTSAIQCVDADHAEGFEG
jgi:hypothetical protein